jgi:zinc transport system substrate-binding protein
MRYRIITTLILFSSFCANANPKIVTSITPLASLVAMLTEDAAEVEAINVSPGCPHHYQMKPSDKTKILNAKIFIYIDENFDSFAANLAKKFKGRVVKISDFKTLNFQDYKGAINWHFWLDLKNVLAFYNELAEILIKEMPELQMVIESNRDKARSKIQLLISLKENEISFTEEIVLVSDSLEHFFKNVDANIARLYQKTYSSLKDYSDIKNILGSNTQQCVIIDARQDDTIYKKFNKKIIKLESENWESENKDIAEIDLFYTKYLEMINLLKACKSTN